MDIMGWYDDKKATIHIEKYKNEKDAQKDAEKAVKKGWVLQEMVTSNGHVNLFRTIFVRGLILGASRTKGSLVVTYSRPVCPYPKCGKPVIDNAHRLENGETWHDKCWNQSQEELRKQQQKEDEKQARKDNSKGLFGLMR